MDVCAPGAIHMRHWRSRTPEGLSYSYLALQSSANMERPVVKMASFPYLARAENCNGCRECVRQCPASALLLLAEQRRPHDTLRQ
jgi:ferredoxin